MDAEGKKPKWKIRKKQQWLRRSERNKTTPSDHSLSLSSEDQTTQTALKITPSIEEAHKGSPKAEVVEDVLPTEHPRPLLVETSGFVSSTIVSPQESSLTKAQAKDRVCTLLKSLRADPLEFEDHASILEDTLKLCSVDGNQYIERFIISFVENTKSLKERHDEAHEKFSEVVQNLSKIVKLKSKLESDTKKKEDIQRQEADVNQKISEISAAISQIEEEIARLQASKLGLEDERAILEASRLSLASANRSIEADLQQTSTHKDQLFNLVKSEASKFNAAYMELDLIKLETREIENKVLYFIEVIENM